MVGFNVNLPQFRINSGKTSLEELTCCGKADHLRVASQIIKDILERSSFCLVLTDLAFPLAKLISPVAPPAPRSTTTSSRISLPKLS